jgi:hypothetical protein
VTLPRKPSKNKLRRLHSMAVLHTIASAKKTLCRHEEEFLGRIAGGHEVRPDRIAPRLVEVKSRSDEALFFRYASLHWSIPISSGYGRRLRFLVIDEQNDKLMGLFGLSDPVFNLAGRDRWIGWDRQTQLHNLRHLMDAFILGAVPPYSFLLGGKLIAMLAASNDVREAFTRKYRGARTVIAKEEFDGRLALLTTTSALGRSSIYNRLRYKDRLLFQPTGYTRGSGEFQFSNGLYGAIQRYASRYCEPTAKKDLWGTGFRNRREVVKKCLPKVGLSSECIYHGVNREIFVIPLASNTREFLRGEHRRLNWFDQPACDLFKFFRERWLMPRSVSDQRYREWDARKWSLWGPDKD